MITETSNQGGHKITGLLFLFRGQLRRLTACASLLAAVALCGALHAQSVQISTFALVPAGNVAPGTQNHATLDFNLQLTGGTVAFTGLQVAGTGSAVTADFSGFDLYRDTDSSATVNAGDVLVASGSLAGGFVTFSGFNVNVAGFQTYLVAVDVAAGATVGNTFGANSTQSGFTFSPGGTSVSGGSQTGEMQTISGAGAPVMEVENAISTPIAHNSTYDIAAVLGNTPVAGWGYDYIILNTGSATLTLSGAPVVISANTNCVVTPTQPTTSTILAGNNVMFALYIAPVAAGSFSFVVTIDNNSAQTPYSFIVTGNAGSGGGGGGDGGGDGSGGCSTGGTQGGLLLIGLAAMLGVAIRARRV